MSNNQNNIVEDGHVVLSPTTTTSTFDMTHQQTMSTVGSTNLDGKSSTNNTTKKLMMQNQMVNPKNSPSKPKSVKSQLSSQHSKGKSLKKSETAKSSTARFTLPFCHKVIELNFMRLASIFGLVISIIGVIIIAIITIHTFIGTSFPVFYTLKLFGDSVHQFNKMTISQNLFVLSKDLTKIETFNQSRNEMIYSFNELFRLLPESAAKIFPNSSKDASTISLFPLQDAILEQTLAGNYSQAVNLLMEPEHFSKSSSFLDDYFLFIDDIRNISNSQQALISSSSTTYLIVVIVCLVIILPVVIAIFVSLLRMERVSRRKLIKAKKYQLLSTLDSVVEKSLFKQWIRSQNNASNMQDLNCIDLLEDIQEFKNPDKQQVRMMKNFIEDLKNLSSEDSSIDHDTLSESSEAYSINTTSSITSQGKSESMVIHIYEKYLNPMCATNLVKTKGQKKVANYLRDRAQQDVSNTNGSKQLNIFDDIQLEAIKQLIPSFEKFQKSQSSINSNKTPIQSFMTEGKVLNDFRVEFKGFLKNYEKLVKANLNNSFK